MNFSEQLEEGLKQFSLTSLLQPLSDYLLLLHKWNATYNLTAIRSLEEMVYKHALDSLAIIPWLKGSKIIDVGTGPGLPGIPLALAQPEIEFVLLDSNGKKTRFLKEVKGQLDLKNLEIVQSRVETHHPIQKFDTVISRAFSSLKQMVDWTQHLIAPEGRWLAMKGRIPTEELALILKPYQVQSYEVQGITGERCCILIDNIITEEF